VSGLDARLRRRVEQGLDILDILFLRDLDYKVLSVLFNIYKNVKSIIYLTLRAH
jgi:hypothetical protein